MQIRIALLGLTLAVGGFLAGCRAGETHPVRRPGEGDTHYMLRREAHNEHQRGENVAWVGEVIERRENRRDENREELGDLIGHRADRHANKWKSGEKPPVGEAE